MPTLTLIPVPPYRRYLYTLHGQQAIKIGIITKDDLYSARNPWGISPNPLKEFKKAHENHGSTVIALIDTEWITEHKVEMIELGTVS